VCVFRFLRMPTMQHCPHSPATHCCWAAISRYLVPTGPTAANLRPCHDTQTTLRVLDGQWQQMKTEWWLTHSQVESISLNQIGQFVEQVSSVCSIHASPWRSQTERITCCLNGFVNVGLDTIQTQQDGWFIARQIDSLHDRWRCKQSLLYSNIQRYISPSTSYTEY